ncbi:hypothetical protein AB0H37_38270 [Actinomadura sp. NPDC023710]|uniref:hypothetical protein n=1 Tax=Actinomadura sp. NPDC023710 TaxID=3158219 RepID=UPI0033CD90AB
MTDTTSAAAPVQTSPGQRSFAEAMHAMHAKYVAKNGYKAGKHKAWLIPALHLAGGAVLGGACRMLLSPMWAAAVTGALTALVGAWAVLAVCMIFRVGLLRGVDWATADDYEQQLIAGLDPDARAALTHAQHQVLRRFPAAASVHVYRPDQLPGHRCTLDTAGCDCARSRFNAAVLPNRRHPVIVVGDRLLDQPAALAYVLAHETNHVRRPWLQVFLLLQLVSLGGWAVLGLMLPWPTLLTAAPALWGATLLLRWTNEFAADIAARTTGPDAARQFWTMLRAVRPASTGLSRLSTATVAVLAPSHPPRRPHRPPRLTPVPAEGGASAAPGHPHKTAPVRGARPRPSLSTVHRATPTEIHAVPWNGSHAWPDLRQRAGAASAPDASRSSPPASMIALRGMRPSLPCEPGPTLPAPAP